CSDGLKGLNALGTLPRKGLNALGTLPWVDLYN
uniref:Putative leucine-rich repeat protein PS14 (Fragments) n=1 Tax=Pinus strobus TaxID=3348 RepID=PS14_PINST|nr:RecName: Full=Putative leucine-rich repeat protein PS14; Short=LRR [Pinus strobus]